MSCVDWYVCNCDMFVHMFINVHSGYACCIDFAAGLLMHLLLLGDSGLLVSIVIVIPATYIIVTTPDICTRNHHFSTMLNLEVMWYIRTYK